MATDTTSTITPNETTPRRSRSRRKLLSNLLGATVAAIFVLAFLGFGGVHHGTRAVLHLLSAVACGLAIALPRHTLARAGRLWTLFAVAGLLALASCTGLLPVPSALARLVAPGLLARRPEGVVLATSSLDLEATADAATHLVLLVGAAVLLGTWGLAHWRRRPIELALTALAATLPVIALSHAVTDTTALFGAFPTWIRPPYKFLAPFISHGHAGSALLLSYPLVLAFAFDRDRTRFERTIYAGLLALDTVAVLYYRATAPVALLGVLTLVVAWRLRWAPRWLLVLAAPVGLSLAVGFDVFADPGNLGDLHGRTGIWWSSLSLLRDHWLFGTGLGTFAEAIGPYRTDHDWFRWDHAHQDYLEWVVETGVFGALCVVAAGLLARPGTARDDDRAWLATAGAGGVLLHALVDFPLQIPALGMSVAGLLAWRIVVHQEKRTTRPLGLRVALGGLLVAQLAAGGWQVRDRAVEPASLVLQGGPGDEAGAARTLSRLAPWRPELALYQAKTALERGDRDEAARLLTDVLGEHGFEPDALRGATVLLVHVRDADRALEVAARAVAEGPWDWRNHVVLARATTVFGTPEEAASAWHDAIAAGAPPVMFEEAWKVLPVGLYWVSAVDEATSRQDGALGNFLVKHGDPEAAALAFEQAALDDPDTFHPGYVDALLALDRLDEADRYVRLASAAQSDDARWLRRIAELHERQGRWEQASKAWTDFARRGRGGRARAIQAMRHTEGGDRAALDLLQRMAIDGTRLDPEVMLLRASLQASLGLREECIRDLAGSGLLEAEPKVEAKARAALDACTPETEPRR